MLYQVVTWLYEIEKMLIFNLNHLYGIIKHVYMLIFFFNE